MASQPSTSIFIGSGPGGAKPQALELKRAKVASDKAASEHAKLEAQAKREAARAASEAAKPSMTDKLMQSAGRAMASSVGRQIGNYLLRGILGSLTGKGARYGLVSKEELRVRTPEVESLEVRNRRVGGRERTESEHGAEGETA